MRPLIPYRVTSLVLELTPPEGRTSFVSMVRHIGDPDTWRFIAQSWSDEDTLDASSVGPLSELEALAAIFASVPHVPGGTGIVMSGQEP